MRITIERLRTWIVVLGLLLLVAIGAFLGYARYRVRQAGKDLPQKLGMEVQQSTNDFTLSPSSGGHTKFVLHAAKAVQYKGGGRAVLHDVSILLYDKDGQPTDRITGKEFDYDPSNRTARADGAVDIELLSPISARNATAAAPAKGPQMPVRVKTSGLVFNQTTQVAMTEQALTFTQGDATGSARGATYDAQKGMLTLAHDVVVHTRVDEQPVAIRAESATFDRDARQLFLVKDQADYDGRHGTSDQATLFFRPNGMLDHVSSSGDVRLKSDDGSDLQASSSVAQLNAAGVMQQVKLDGGLLFIHRDAQHSLHVNSTGATFSFQQDARRKSEPNHLQLEGAVSVVDQQLSLPGDPHGSETREARASKMDLDLGRDAAGHTQAQSVLASGGANVLLHTIHEKAPQQVTRLKGDELYAKLVGGHELSSLRATGSAAVEQSTPGGASQTGSGDVLTVKFVPAAQPAVRKQKGVGRGSEIANALLEGHAALTQMQAQMQAPGAGGQPAALPMVAGADRISLDGATGDVLLSGGSPHVQQGDSLLSAPSIVFNRTSGDGKASGGVKATYANGAAAKSGGNEVTHVVADQALLDHAKDETTFLGTAGADARLWQGATSIAAPKIVLSRTRQLLTASGAAAGVKATFLENSGAHAQAPAGAPAVVRTASAALLYSGGEQKATLTGGVMVQDGGGTIRAAQMEIFLNQDTKQDQSRGGDAKRGAAAGPAGRVDHLVAEKDVTIRQGARTGTGSKLVYTAEDGHFVLTGTAGTPPQVTDAEHGSVTGSSLIFNNRDDSVVVSRGQNATATDTHTRSAHSKSDHPASR